MIITGMHWLVATMVAVAVHLVGILWLSIASPEPQPDVESASEGIVVTLGRQAPTAAGSRDAPEPQTPADTTVAATEEVEPPQSDATPEALQPEEPAPEEPVTGEPTPEVEPAVDDAVAAEPEPAPAPEPSAADTASPETPEARPLDEAASVDPESARAPDAAQAGAVEPEAAEPAQDVETVTVEVRTVASETDPASAPDAPETSAVGEAPAPSQPAVPSTETPEESAVESPQAPVQPRETVPTEPADDAPIPARSGPPESAREVETADPGAAPVPETVARPRPETAGENVAGVEEVETAPAQQGSPRAVRETEAPAMSDDPDIDEAAVRQPAPEVPAASEPEAAETAVPETVKLEDLQQRSGGSGVVASYAGVLKGWLQRNMHYPRAARLAGQEGNVVIRFVIDRQGNVQSVELESGSGHSLLDREATEMVERGDPFPAMPDDMPGERLEVRVPVSFEVRDADRTRDLPPIYLE